MTVVTLTVPRRRLKTNGLEDEEANELSSFCLSLSLSVKMKKIRHPLHH